MNEIRRPISESYWVEPGQFLAGEHPAKFDEEQTRRRVDTFIETGIDTFIDLTQANETFPYTRILAEQANVYGVEAAHHRFPIGDFGLPSDQMMNAILDKIDQSLRDRRKIYLHCWGGIGRTGTVASQDSYGRGPVERRMTPFRGEVRGGNSGGPVIGEDGEVLTTVFASSESSGGASA